MEGLCKLLKCSAHVSSARCSRALCLLFQRRVQDVISPIVFEAAYSLGEHVTGEEEKELPALTPVLRWKKGQKIAQKNQVPENSWLGPSNLPYSSSLQLLESTILLSLSLSLASNIDGSRTL